MGKQSAKKMYYSMCFCYCEFLPTVEIGYYLPLVMDKMPYSSLQGGKYGRA